MPSEPVTPAPSSEKPLEPTAVEQELGKLSRNELWELADKLGVKRCRSIEEQIQEIRTKNARQIRKARAPSSFERHGGKLKTGLRIFGVIFIPLLLAVYQAEIRDFVRGKKTADESLAILDKYGKLDDSHREFKLTSSASGVEFSIVVEAMRDVGVMNLNCADPGEAKTLLLDDRHVEALSRLPTLERLNLSGNVDVKDVSCLGACESLTHLYLAETGVSDVSALRDSTALEYLDLSGTKVTSVIGLAYLSHLNTLYLDDTPIETVSHLWSAPNLRFLSIKNTAGLRECGLQDMPELRDLELEGIPAQLMTIKNLPQLSLLHIENCSVSTLVMEDLEWLQVVHFVNNKEIEELPLAGFSKLERVAVTSNDRLKAIELADLPSLNFLAVGQNPVLAEASLLNVRCPEPLDFRWNNEVHVTTDNEAIGIELKEQHLQVSLVAAH